jgi:hypothetical protein
MIFDTPLSPLEKNALWIIMDPWYPTPVVQDISDHPNLDDINMVTMKKIVSYVHRLKHAVVSMDTDMNIYHELRHISNIGYDYDMLEQYILTHGIRDIVYMGFHHGRCITDRDTGLMAVKTKLKDSVNLWVKRDMVGIFPGDDPAEKDIKTLQYANFISSSCI